MPWWLDVEDPSFPDNHQAGHRPPGAGDDRRSPLRGINSVGIYASPGELVELVGRLPPAVPYWAADWGTDPATTCGNVHSFYPGLPPRPGPDRPVRARRSYGSGTYDDGLRLLSARRRARPTDPRPARDGRRLRPAADAVRAQVVRAVVVAEEPPRGRRRPPRWSGRRAGSAAAAGPRPAPGHRELGQQRRLDHAGVAGHHHQLARMAGGHHVEGVGHPVDEAGPALAPRGDRRPGIGVPVRVPNRSVNSAQSRPSASPGWSSQKPHSWTGSRDRSGPPEPATGRRGRRQQLGGLDGPGQDARRRGRRPRPARRSRAAGPAAPRPGPGPGRSGPGSPTGPPHTPDTLHTASPWRTSTIRVAEGVPAPMVRIPAGGASGPGPRADPVPAPVSASKPGARAAHASSPDELLELAQGPALDHLVAVVGVLAHDGVARVPVGAGLGIEPVDVAGPGLHLLDHPGLRGVVVVPGVAQQQDARLRA